MVRLGIRTAQIAAATAVLWLATASGQVRAEVLIFPESSFGKADLVRPQAAGGDLESLGGTGRIELVSELLPQDPFRKLGRPIGRLDILAQSASGRRGTTSCTAAVLSEDLIITNAHCVPGDGQDIAQVFQAQLRLGYLQRGGGEAYTVAVEPVEVDPVLDYSILRVAGNPAEKFGSVKLNIRDAAPGESLFLIHHPKGEPQRLTRAFCRAFTGETFDGPFIRHQCDTIGGSSGALIFSQWDNSVVGIHHQGGLLPDDPTSFNLGTRAPSLLSNSRILASLQAPEPTDLAISSPEPVTVATVDPGSPSTIRKQPAAAKPDATADGTSSAPPQPPTQIASISQMSLEMVTTANINVRSGPSANARKLGLIARDQVVRVTGRVADADWYRVTYAGDNGFVHASLLRTRDASRATLETPGPAEFRPNYEAGRAAYDSGDYSTALRHFMPLAIAGCESKGVLCSNALAQFSVGIMYAKGVGVPMDLTESAKWVRRAAEQGHAGAQNNLGTYYVRGLGVEQDVAQAMMWFTLAAEQGEAQAQYGLGNMLERGLGAPLDRSKALEWYRRAAEQGSEDAKKAVARLQSAATNSSASASTKVSKQTISDDEKTRYQELRGTENVEAFRKFLRDFPRSRYKPFVVYRIQVLQKAG